MTENLYIGCIQLQNDETMAEDTTESFIETDEPEETELRPSFSKNVQLGTTYAVSLMNMVTNDVESIRFQFKYSEPRVGQGFQSTENLFPNEWTDAAGKYWELQVSQPRNGMGYNRLYSTPNRVFLLMLEEPLVAVFQKKKRLDQMFKCMM